MIAERKTSLTMLVLLGILVFIYHFGVALYYAQGLEPSPTFEFLYRAAFICGMVWWLKAETGMSPVVSIYCPGMLVGIGWLIVIPYHLLKTRGLQGLLPFLALMGILVVSRIVVEIVHAVALMM
jgi:hypothetical protein